MDFWSETVNFEIFLRSLWSKWINFTYIGFGIQNNQFFKKLDSRSGEIHIGFSIQISNFESFRICDSNEFLETIIRNIGFSIQRIKFWILNPNKLENYSVFIPVCPTWTPYCFSLYSKFFARSLSDFS